MNDVFVSPEAATDRLVSRAEFAGRLGCSTRKLDRLHGSDANFPRKTKFGGATVWHESTVRAYIARVAQSN